MATSPRNIPRHQIFAPPIEASFQIYPAVEACVARRHGRVGEDTGETLARMRAAGHGPAIDKAAVEMLREAVLYQSRRDGSLARKHFKRRAGRISEQITSLRDTLTDPILANLQAFKSLEKAGDRRRREAAIVLLQMNDIAGKELTQLIASRLDEALAAIDQALVEEGSAS